MNKTYLATLLSALLVSPLHAQQANQTPNDADQVERIMVVGQKIDRELQDTPTSVAVVTKKQIEQQQLMGMFDIFDQVPNIHGDPGRDFSIRGIDAFNVSGGGNSYLASVYVDGAALPYRMIREGGFSTWDVAQVEVLRGPQSTLQGRNALAGAIVMRTTRPTYDFSSKLRVTYGLHGQQEFAGAIGSELIENELAFRISAERNEFDGDNFNTTRQENSAFNDNHTYRLKLLWEPSAIEGLSALLSYTENETNQGVQWINARVNGVKKVDPYNDRTTDFNDPTHEFTDNKILNLEIDYDINDEWSFASVTTSVDSYYGYRWDGDSSPITGNVLIDDRDDKTFSQELRLVYQGDALSSVMGVYYSNLKVDDLYSGTRLFTFQQLGVRNALIGTFGLPPATADLVLSFYGAVDPVVLDTNGDLTQEVSTAAAYADFNYEINEQWAVFGGLRYDTEKQENSSDQLITVANADLLPNPTNFSSFGPELVQLIGGINAFLLQQAANASGTEPLTDEDFSAWLPKAGITYNWNDDVSTHFTYQRGYRSGGVGTNIARSQIYSYDPEYTDNYELSFRSVWLNGDLVANANIFWLDWKEQQVNVQLSDNSFDSETQNAGKSSVKGFEIELFYNLNENWRITGGLGQAKTEFTKFIAKIGEQSFDLSGRSFAQAPEWTANIAANYQSESWFMNINANYANSYNALTNPYVTGVSPNGINFDPKGDSRVLVNSRIGYRWESWSLSLNITNLLDEQYTIFPDTLPQQTSSVATMRLGQERKVGLTLEANF